MDADCVKELFSGPMTINELEECVFVVLRTVTQTDAGSRTVLTSHGTKVGYLLGIAPIQEIKVMRYWRGPLGIKVELSYHDKFAGVLLMRK